MKLDLLGRPTDYVCPCLKFGTIYLNPAIRVIPSEAVQSRDDQALQVSDRRGYVGGHRGRVGREIGPVTLTLLGEQEFKHQQACPRTVPAVHAYLVPGGVVDDAAAPDPTEGQNVMVQPMRAYEPQGRVEPLHLERRGRRLRDITDVSRRRLHEASLRPALALRNLA